jgi:hypothetical protein
MLKVIWNSLTGATVPDGCCEACARQQIKIYLEF